MGDATAPNASQLRVHRFPDVRAFLKTAGDFLTVREAEHNLLLGLAGTLVARPHVYPLPPYLAGVLRRATVIGAALRTPPHNLVLSKMDDVGAADALARDVGEVFDDLPGVLGPPEPSRRFADLWVRGRGRTMEAGMAQRIFRAERVFAPGGVTGRMRRAEAGDRALLVSWVAAFQDEAMSGAFQRPAEAAVDDYLARGEHGGMYVWEDREPVSLAGCGSPTPNGIRIGPVYTPPERRGRGYASALTAEVTSLLLSSGRQFCFLFTDLANPTSNRIYQRIGYEPVTDVMEFRFARAASPRSPSYPDTSGARHRPWPFGTRGARVRSRIVSRRLLTAARGEATPGLATRALRAPGRGSRLGRPVLRRARRGR